ncbi:MAG: hypothetical protein ACRC0X_03630 [Brevinema sp.]
MSNILRKGLLVLNIVIFIGSIMISYMFSDQISTISDQYITLITPIDYTFAIWGLIYLLALFYNLYFFVDPKFQVKFVFIQLVLFVLNALWTVLWSNHYIVLSWLAIVTLWLILLYAVIDISKEHEDRKILKEYFFLYFAWISVASSINTIVVLMYLGLPGSFTWGVISVLALGVASFIINRKQNVLLFSVTVIWALVGIFMQPVVLFPFFQNFRYLVLAMICLLTLDFLFQWYLKLKKATD